ncbi:hypothetical protein [Roseospira marina]|uniref:hypothetical protein n=1 Tax=Roseospira marina TaxID=140057 RepID=UPI001232692D|nr:hypothetical protein [Roseospira marina]MBB4315953.1 hypothetical protein [Roseospira marina]MBB5089086.1 hypothetical protein [Roseospira marina]
MTRTPATPAGSGSPRAGEGSPAYSDRSTGPDRRDRSAAALRANLARRKAQVRQRTETVPAPDADGADTGSSETTPHTAAGDRPCP